MFLMSQKTLRLQEVKAVLISDTWGREVVFYHGTPAVLAIFWVPETSADDVSTLDGFP